MTDDRPEPPLVADERATLVGFLEFQRATLAMKCAGLNDDQLRARTVGPSTMSLLGLVRHLTDVERHWFERVLAGRDVEFRYWAEGGDSDFDGVEAADAREDFSAWESQRAESLKISADRALDDTGTRRDEAYSHRWILTHMIEEYARHNGHADLLRERIDGATGE